MRSRAEVAFRARQELANIFLLVAQPRFSGEIPLHLALPDGRSVAEALCSSDYARDVETLAGQILEHRFPVLGTELSTEREIRWRRDYVHGQESGTGYFRRIPYLDFRAVGDHKIVWELNRHQHLVLLAQAFLFTGRAEYTREIAKQLEGWIEQNPFQRGINWASALEVAFRALSLVWVYVFVGDVMPFVFGRGLF